MKSLINIKSKSVIYYSLALAHQGIGNFEKTIFYCNKVLEIDPKFTRADHLISQSTKYKKKMIIKYQFKKIILIKKYEKIDLLFSLAKAEEDLGRIDYVKISYRSKQNQKK